MLSFQIRVNGIKYSVQATSVDDFVCTPSIPDHLVEKVKTKIWNTIVTPGKFAFVVPHGKRRRGGVRGA